MKYQIFSDTEWIYPDTEITDAGNKAVIYSARGADADFQVITDIALEGGESFSFEFTGLECTPVIYQLLPVHVCENSGPKVFTTTEYDEVKDFVTRKAPFTLYEMTKPLDDGKLNAGRAAFYVRLDVAADAVPGTYDGTITLNVGAEKVELPVSLKVYNTAIPTVDKANFHMVNWLYYPRLAEQHNVEAYSDEYKALLTEYLKNELDMRNDYLMIPSGEPVRDDEGNVIDFDFSHAEYVGKLALYMGFTKIMGGFVARFNAWDDPELFLLWEKKLGKDVGSTTIEGFRQLKLYFTRAWECVRKNGWEKFYQQCLVDEPQFPNSLAYRALSGICRQNMPGVKINDPVETTDIAGAVDVWVVKQAVWEKHLENYKKLQATGEEMWLYTCGFPAGRTMNRIMDLPLTVSRLPMWLCYMYDCPGFLHWGYHAYDPVRDMIDGMPEGCTPAGARRYPAGNAHVVYMGDGRPWYGVRGHAQRTGAIDYELFYQLGLKDKEKALELIRRVCRSFDDYDGSSELFDEVRHELLEILG